MNTTENNGLPLTTVQTVTTLLQEWQNGDAAALDQLTPLVYHELRAIAHRHMRREQAGHLLQTTALVNELWLKLADTPAINFQDRLHFLAVAARVMRHLLVDFARQQKFQKRGGGALAISLERAALITPERSLEFIALHEALDRLAKFDQRKSQIVELRYFGGLSSLEIAQVLGLAEITIKREWLKTKAWLYQELAGKESVAR